jgi:putative ABC transport system permease protein
MYALHTKLFRELWQLRWQNLAIASVLAAGVSVVIMSISTLHSLQSSRARFYDQSRFGHVFIHLKRAPQSLLPRVREIVGVQSVDARVVTQVNLTLPDMLEPATGRIVSLPDRGQPSVNKLYLRAGRFVAPNRTGEVLLSEGFAETHQLRPGDSLTAIINGKRRLLRVVGIALSAEYVYSVRPGEMLPDDKRYGVMWMAYEELSSACDLHDAFNDLSLTLSYDASEAAVLSQLDTLLAAYGGANAYGRELQPSHRFLENELIQLRTMAIVPPAIFLIVTVFLIQVVISRQIAIQREQIAMMRAFGYRPGELVLHYLSFAIVIGLSGVVIGTLIGAKLGSDLTVLYTRFFRFPVIDYQLDWRLVLVTTSVALCAVMAGVWNAVWKAALIPPAQAMQPEAPPRYRPSFIERVGLQSILSQTSRIVLRHLERWPIRSALSTVGIALSVAILVMGNFVQDTVEHVLDFQFFSVHRQDLMVTFVEPTTQDAIFELQRMPGVRTVEPFRAVPVRLVHQHNKRRMELLGLPANQELFRVVDPNRGPIELPPGGLVLSRRLADVLGCRCGDQVKVEFLEGLRMTSELPIAAVIDDYLDLSAYIELDSLHRLVREQDAVSGATMSIDSAFVEKLYQQLQQTPRVVGVSIKRADIESFQKTMAENILRMKLINVLFASIVAVGVVYNCARISLAERSRELATLRVLGFTRGEVSRILLGELSIFVVFAIPLGLMMGYGLSWLFSLALNTELHRFPLVILGRTYALAVVVVVLASLASAVIVRRRINHFNLVEVLKARD